jgi:VWFA-related protein
MTRVPRLVVTLSALVAAGAAVSAGHAMQQRPSFLSGVDEVLVNVSVHQGNLAVTDLKAEDFQITDNGVPQTVDGVSGDSLPIDLTLVLDVSGSVQSMMDQLKADVRETSKMLRDDDRLRLVTFTDTVVETLPFQPASSDLDLDRMPPAGMTSIYEAAAAAMMRTRTPDRHELVVLFTDGYENSSTIGGASVLDIARRSDALLDIFIVMPTALPILTHMADHSNNTRGGWSRFLPEEWSMSLEWLDKAAGTTGGQLQEIIGEAHVPRGLQIAIDDMHASYIVYYRPKSVAKPGWHDIKIKLKRPGDFSIRARKGYFGAAK